MLAMDAAAVALKVAVVEPAVTVTDAGTLSRVLLLASVTLDPPGGVVRVSVTVHVLTAPGPKLAGLHSTPETRTGPSRVKAAACELLPRAAVTVAL